MVGRSVKRSDPNRQRLKQNVPLSFVQSCSATSDRAEMVALMERLCPDDVELETYTMSAAWNLFGEVPDRRRKGEK